MYNRILGIIYRCERIFDHYSPGNVDDIIYNIINNEFYLLCTSTGRRRKKNKYIITYKYRT